MTWFHYRDAINKAFVTLMLVMWTRTLCLWTGTHFRAGLVLSMITPSARKRMFGSAWPSAHVNLTRACMVQTPKTYKCSTSSTTGAGWPRKRAHLELGLKYVTVLFVKCPTQRSHFGSDHTFWSLMCLLL